MSRGYPEEVEVLEEVVHEVVDLVRLLGVASVLELLDGPFVSAESLVSHQDVFHREPFCFEQVSEAFEDEVQVLDVAEIGLVVLVLFVEDAEVVRLELVPDAYQQAEERVQGVQQA